MSAPVIDGVLWKRAPHSAVTLYQQRTCKLENAVLSYMSGKGSPKTVELLPEMQVAFAQQISLYAVQAHTPCI